MCKRNCPQCGATELSAAGACPACGATLPDDGPWLHPAVEAGGRAFRWSALGTTLGAILTAPENTFSKFRWDGGLLAPTFYASILGGPATAVGYVLGAYLRTGDLRHGVSRAWFLFLLVVAPFVYVYVRSQIIHLALVFLGAASRPFSATYRAVAYGNSSAALCWLLPVLGSFLFLVWGTFLEIIALRAAHRLPVGAALVAVLLPGFALAAGLLAGLAVDLLFLWS